MGRGGGLKGRGGGWPRARRMLPVEEEAWDSKGGDGCAGSGWRWCGMGKCCSEGTEGRGARERGYRAGRGAREGGASGRESGGDGTAGGCAGPGMSWRDAKRAWCATLECVLSTCPPTRPHAPTPTRPHAPRPKQQAPRAARVVLPPAASTRPSVFKVTGKPLHQSRQPSPVTPDVTSQAGRQKSRLTAAPAHRPRAGPGPGRAPNIFEFRC